MGPEGGCDAVQYLFTDHSHLRLRRVDQPARELAVEVVNWKSSEGSLFFMKVTKNHDFCQIERGQTLPRRGSKRTVTPKKIVACCSLDPWACFRSEIRRVPWYLIFHPQRVGAS